MNNYLQAIDARTGKSIMTFGTGGLVDLREGLGRDPKTLTRAQSGTPGKIFENLILLGSSTGENYVSSPGHLRAYDIVTGKLVWTFHTIPRSIDWPSVYGKVEKRDPPGPEELAGSGQVESGKEIYMRNCQGCHGAERRGGMGPQLLDLKSRFEFKKFQQVVLAGKGEMSAFASLDEKNLRNIFQYLVTGSAMVRENRLVNNKPADRKPVPLTGPVVDSGGAPGGQDLREIIGPARAPANMGMRGYGIPYPGSKCTFYQVLYTTRLGIGFSLHHKSSMVINCCL